MDYTLYTDPGHGWLAVERAELERLGLADKISSYSFQHRGTVYLEEDVDARVFTDAKKCTGEPYTVRTEHTDHSSRIRRYKSYK